MCTSPLTRAVATCVLALGHIPAREGEATTLTTAVATTPFICHPDLAEVGSSIPENRGRPITTVLREVRNSLKHHGEVSCLNRIDFSLLPPSWPDTTASASAPKNKPSVRIFLQWLHDRPETNIAVVCHHNVIQNLLHDRRRVPNCVPITCVMNEGDPTSLYLT